MKEIGLSFKGLKIIIYLTLAINAMAIALSVIGNFDIINIAGYIYLLALCIDLGAIFFTFINLNAADEKGKILKAICYIFLGFFFFALFLLLFKQIVFMTETDPLNIRYVVAELIHNFAYFGILGFGILLSLLDLKYLHRSETWLD